MFGATILGILASLARNHNGAPALSRLVAHQDASHGRAAGRAKFVRSASEFERCWRVEWQRRVVHVRSDEKLMQKADQHDHGSVCLHA